MKVVSKPAAAAKKADSILSPVVPAGKDAAGFDENAEDGEQEQQEEENADAGADDSEEEEEAAAAAAAAAELKAAQEAKKKKEVSFPPYLMSLRIQLTLFKTKQLAAAEAKKAQDDNKSKAKEI